MWDSKRDTDVKNRLMDSVGEGKGGMIWENSIETNTYMTICEVDHQSRFSAWDRILRAGALGWPWWMGWGGRWKGCSGWGTRVPPRLIHVNVWQNPLQYCKVISLQLIKINEKKEKKNSFIFNRRIITLQYCLGFYHTSTWICHRYAYVLSLMNLPPSTHSMNEFPWTSWGFYLSTIV